MNGLKIRRMTISFGLFLIKHQRKIIKKVTALLSDKKASFMLWSGFFIFF